MQIGDRVPELLGIDQDGIEITRESLKGQRVVLYFYPKDNTSGCTAQACSLRDGIDDLIAAGYTVIGVSKDSAKSHHKFIDQHQLPFRLIADTDTTLQQTMGVWVEKSMYGRKYMGTLRTTFVLDEEGVIRAVISGKDVRTKDHAQQLLALLPTL